MATKAEERCGLSVSDVVAILDYNPETGRFSWKQDRITGNPPRIVRSAGDDAGCILPSGYRLICINYNRFRASRLAWFIMTGEWPKSRVDHKNLKRNDDRWENLRLATNGQNMANTKARAKSGFKGVTVPKHAPNSYVSQITVNGEHIHLGTYKTPEAAHAAYRAAAIEAFGEFARFD